MAEPSEKRMLLVNVQTTLAKWNSKKRVLLFQISLDQPGGHKGWQEERYGKPLIVQDCRGHCGSSQRIWKIEDNPDNLDSHIKCI